MTRSRLKVTRASEIAPEAYRNQWGPWRLDAATYVLYVPDDPERDDRLYEIDLESCVSSAELCDWIFQVYGKTWADEPTLAGLIGALDDLLSPQVNLCSWGQNLKLTKTRIRALVDAYAANQPSETAPPDSAA